MTYHRETGQVQYQSKDKKETRVFDALEWPRFEAGCWHSRQCVLMYPTRAIRWFGMEFIRLWRSHYSNVARGKRKKADIDDKVPCILEPELTDTAFRRNWARLMQKIHPVEFPIGNPIQLGK
ncbi:MAG TPA: hypothetical protein ENI07_16680 [Desulfobacterales bacterium]|nr:hypothetical protein [Desulfobacterales bacterium]